MNSKKFYKFEILTNLIYLKLNDIANLAKSIQKILAEELMYKVYF